MSVIFYPSFLATDDVPFTMSPIGTYDDTSVLVHANMHLTHAGSSSTSHSFSDSDASLKKILYRMLYSPELVPGQTIFDNGIDPVTLVDMSIRCHGDDIHNNMYTSLAVYVVNINGPTVQKTLLTHQKDNTEMPADNPPSASLPASRYFSQITDGGGDYTTVPGDFIVAELGSWGDPDPTYDHDARFLHEAGVKAGDLPASDGELTALWPWIRLVDQTLTFRNIKKINGVRLGYIQKINGIDIEDVKKINGVTL